MMDGQTAGRPDRRLRRLLGCTAMLVLAVGPSGRPAVGQVGHDPGTSPYRDVLLLPALAVYGGYLSGDRGRIDAGPSNMSTIGLRYELPSGKSMLFQFHLAYLMGDRFIIDHRADSTSPARKTGPYESNLVLTEIALNHRLTGAKTWHRLGPYLGVGLGLLFDVHSPGDTTNSGYKFGTKVGLAPIVGTRWYPFRRVIINGEARLQAWRLSYPSTFHGVYADDGSRVIPLTQSLKDWTWHPWLSLSVGWNF